MVCTTPPYNGFDGSFEHVTSDIPVDITVNGNPAERTNLGVKFRYYREDRHVLPKLHGVQPFGGPAAGGTVVTIHGSLLLTLVEIGGPVCRFDSGVDNTTTVQQRFVEQMTTPRSFFACRQCFVLSSKGVMCP